LRRGETQECHYLDKKVLEQGREPTKQISWFQESNPGHTVAQ